MVWIILGSILGVIVLILLVAVIICSLNPGKNERPAKGGKTGFVHTEGRNIYDGEGNLLKLHGVNLGNWFIQECWMSVSSTDSLGKQYTTMRGAEAMKNNPNLTDEQIERLNNLYLDTYITEADFARIAGMGLNCVRVPFGWFNLEYEDGTDREDGFTRLDNIIALCKKYGLYAILDLHGARGSQNMDMHSGDDEHYDLYGNLHNREMTKNLWRKLAMRYRDEPTIAAYDLLNETRKAPGKYTGKEQFDYYDELYNTIREVDRNHMTMVECFSFPVHGVNETKYDWENMANSYHIYNRVPIPQMLCLFLYNGMHVIKNYRMPLVIGEWCTWGNPKDWENSMDYYDRHGWSYISWTYKTNGYMYNRDGTKYNTWGVYELDMPPVDVSVATYEEIEKVYGSVGTENAKPTILTDVYMKRFKE